MRLREYYPPPAVDWTDVESVKAWIEHVRWYAFFNGARHAEISRVEAEKLVELLSTRSPMEEDDAT